MPNVEDGRYTKCDERIKEALLILLAEKPLSDIGVSELARQAKVSRTTFYSHFDNVGNVYDQFVEEIMSEVQPFDERFSCDGSMCKSSNRSTYCEKIRSRGHWANVTSDPRFFKSMMALGGANEPSSYDAADLGISKREFEAIRLFQMSGCHAVATSDFGKQRDWSRYRDLLDLFIEGGLNAIKDHEKNTWRKDN